MNILKNCCDETTCNYCPFRTTILLCEKAKKQSYISFGEIYRKMKLIMEYDKRVTRKNLKEFEEVNEFEDEYLKKEK